MKPTQKRLLPLLTTAIIGISATAQSAVLVISDAGLNPGPFSTAFATAQFGADYQTTSVASVFKADITAADSFSPGVTVKQYLQGFSLVVFGSAVGSGSTTFDRPGWAGVTTGILSISPFQTRNDRAGWYNSGSAEFTLGTPSTNETTLNTPTHPIVAGLTNPANIYSDGFGLQSATLNSGALPNVGTGTIVGTLNADSGQIGNNLGPVIMAWNTGQQFGGTGTHTVAGPRTFFALNQNAFTDTSLTAGGLQAFQQAVQFTSIPEPSAALLGAVGMLALLTNRRRSA